MKFIIELVIEILIHFLRINQVITGFEQNFNLKILLTMYRLFIRMEIITSLKCESEKSVKFWNSINAGKLIANFNKDRILGDIRL